jgi:acyl-CoA thioesterase-2
VGEPAERAPSFETMMTLTPHGADTFVGTGPRYPWGGLYGGQIVAQGLRAAGLTVESGFRPHSLHAYFIRPGDHAEPIRFEVDRLRNGRSFATRRVEARQSIGAILTMAASFQVDEEGPAVQSAAAPAVAKPDALESSGWSDLFDRRFAPTGEETGRASAWLRIVGPVPADPLIDACALAFMSDDLPTDSVFALHPDVRAIGEWAHERFMSASLDHAIWFHRPHRGSDWQLHDFTCHGLLGSRGVGVGHVFTLAGVHTATITQEVLVRPRR